VITPATCRACAAGRPAVVRTSARANSGSGPAGRRPQRQARGLRHLRQGQLVEFAVLKGLDHRVQGGAVGQFGLPGPACSKPSRTDFAGPHSESGASGVLYERG
jgi:hypothetical protein